MTARDVFGAEIQYFRIDPRYWGVILQRLKDTGLRCVTTYVPWNTHLVGEPDQKHPAGVLDFEGRTDPRRNLLRFLDLVADSGLDMNFRAGPFCCNEMVHGGYPRWLVLGDPDMMVWDWQNRTTQGYWIARHEGSQPSYLHPAYLDACRRWFDEVDRIIRSRLVSAGGFISMVNLDNEVSYIVKDSFLDSDYNPVNVAPGGFYHSYLTEKYGSSARIPYGRRYKAIEDITPPRSVPREIGRDFAWYADWMEFKTWVMCRYVETLRRFHEENGVRDVVFMTNFNPHLPEGVPTRMPDMEKATGGGIVGYDFYRGTFMSYSGYHSMARVLKLMNASLSFTWSAEFMAGTWRKILTGRVSDDHMRFMARCALAHGCKAIDWFMFHDRECWGDAPVSAHGHLRSSWEVLREIPEMLFNRIGNWDALKPQADVAVIYDRIQHVHTAIGDPAPCADNAMHVGAPRIDGVEAGIASREYYGLFRLAEQAGAQAAVVDIMHKATPLQEFPLAFLPGSPVLERKAGAALKRYIGNGGTLVVTGSWPLRDETGRTFRFLGFPHAPKPGVETRIRIGKGLLIWRSDPIAQDEAESESLASIHFVRRLLRGRGIRPQVSMEPLETVAWTDLQPGKAGQAETIQPRNLGSAVLHTARGEQVLFLLNHYPEAVRFRVRFGRIRPRALECLSTGMRLAVRNGTVIVDLDRKSGEIYRVIDRDA